MIIELQPARMLIGIEIRTSNETPQEIAALWRRFMSKNVADDIPSRADEKLVAAYFDYESDQTGPFTFLLGCEVIDVCCAPDGFSLREIPSGNYADFSACGEMPEALVETWGRIWEADIERTYEADFEIHDPANPNEVTVYVGVR